MIDIEDHLDGKLELKWMLNPRKDMIIHPEDAILLDIQDLHLLPLHHQKALAIQALLKAVQEEVIRMTVGIDLSINTRKIDTNKKNIDMTIKNHRLSLNAMSIMMVETKINMIIKILQYPLIQIQNTNQENTLEKINKEIIMIKVLQGSIMKIFSIKCILILRI